MGKQELLKDFILNQIRTNKLKPGDRVYSRSKFMSKFDCARATVDKVLKDLISAKILYGKKGAGTFVAPVKKAKPSKNIALVSGELGAPSMPYRIAYSFMEHMGPEYNIKFFTYNEIRHPASWQRCKSQQGIIFILPDIQHSPFIIETRTQDIPHIILYRNLPESSFVSIDNQSAVINLVSALAKKGCNNIAYLGIRESRYHFPQERYLGFLEGLLKNQFELKKDLVHFIPEHSINLALNQIFNSKIKPQGIILGSLQGIGQVITKIEKNDFKIGKDVFLACFDPVKENSYPFPVISLKSIAAEIGITGVQVYKEQIKNPQKLIQKYITPKIRKQ
ncbi:MAG: substrate-binding domain-containing protein [Candidatus Omnitrophica bacterium]|nr:substrate-binding domain-containing protein [Candidatus Omnitrophota bacterium]